MSVIFFSCQKTFYFFWQEDATFWSQKQQHFAALLSSIIKKDRFKLG
jgi:hypothetical protein